MGQQGPAARQWPENRHASVFLARWREIPFCPLRLGSASRLASSHPTRWAPGWGDVSKPARFCSPALSTGPCPQPQDFLLPVEKPSRAVRQCHPMSPASPTSCYCAEKKTPTVTVHGLYPETSPRAHGASPARAAQAHGASPTGAGRPPKPMGHLHLPRLFTSLHPAQTLPAGSHPAACWGPCTSSAPQAWQGTRLSCINYVPFIFSSPWRDLEVESTAQTVSVAGGSAGTMTYGRAGTLPPHGAAPQPSTRPDPRDQGCHRGQQASRAGTGAESGCSHLNNPIREVPEQCFNRAGMRPVPYSRSAQLGAMG